MIADKKLLLEHTKIVQKIERIAYQLYEDTNTVDEVYILGIKERGYLFAQELHKHFEKITHQSIILGAIEIDKDNPQSTPININNIEIPEGATIILVDDVLNSGKTLIYAAAEILQKNPERLITTVLVDRRHRRYPIRADHVGLTLSTTLQQHISVVFGEEMTIYLD